MKTASLATLLLILFSNVSSADHNRRLSDQTFALVAQAREIRWDVRENFANSSSKRQLMQDATHIYESLSRLEEMFFDGSSQTTIDRYIHHIQGDVENMESRVDGCDFAQPVFAGHDHNDIGFRDGSRHGQVVQRLQQRHGCYNHVVALKIRLEALCDGLEVLHQFANGNINFRTPEIVNPIILDRNGDPRRTNDPGRGVDPRFTPTMPDAPAPRPQLIVPQTSGSTRFTTPQTIPISQPRSVNRDHSDDHRGDRRDGDSKVVGRVGPIVFQIRP